MASTEHEERNERSASDEIERFTFAERAVHWLVALSFLYAALSGLALFSPHLAWLSSLLGGGTAVRAWHPWGGVVFGVLLAGMFLRWAREMRLDRDDRRWLRRAHRYAVHDERGLPEADRFNAGQKALFWTQSASTLLLVASGVVLWFPEAMSRPLRLAAILVHPAFAIISLSGIIVHVYMATAATPGSFRAMIRGRVRPEWAASHHPKWYRRVGGG